MSTTVLSIDQLLRAAQFLEQNALMNKLVAANGGRIDSTSAALLNFGGARFPSFGEDYKESILATKMRPALLGGGHHRPSGGFIYTSNSTGSSRRSSPLSIPSSSPNSPVSSFSMSSPQQAMNTPPMFMSSASTTTTTTHQSESGAAGSVEQILLSTGFVDVSGGQQQTHKLSTSSRQSRAAHNELEKNRRANLRNYLDTLKSALPNDPECSRDTTLSLLTRARNHIRKTKEVRAELAKRRNALLDEHLKLRELLKNSGGSSSVLFPEPSATAEFASFSSPTAANVQLHLPVTAPSLESSSSVFMLPTSSESQATNFDDESNNENDIVVVVDDVEERKPLSSDAYTLYLNGLLQALPLVYPYSSNIAIATAATKNSKASC